MSGSIGLLMWCMRRTRSSLFAFGVGFSGRLHVLPPCRLAEGGWAGVGSGFGLIKALRKALDLHHPNHVSNDIPT